MYTYPDYMYHYGVIGMKWGQRRASKYQAKANTHKSYAKDYNPKGYIGSKPLSKDQTNRLNKKMNKENAKAQKYQAKANKIQAKHNRLSPDKKTQQYTKNQDMLTTLAKTLVMGSYGSMKYNEARAHGVNRGMSLVRGLAYYGVNSVTSGVASIVEPRIDRKK